MGFFKRRRERKAAARAAASSPPRPAKAPQTMTKKKKAPKKNWLTGSKTFHSMSEWAFDTIDADGSGNVDKKELYTGLLMIHLKLATYAGPAACRPATREYVEEIFDVMDVDGSGSLDKDEFMDVMQIVCSQIFTRVTIQWSCTLIVVPMIARFVWQGLCAANATALAFWRNRLEDLDYALDADRDITGLMWDKIEGAMPGAFLSVTAKIGTLWDKIPDGIKDTLPVTLVSCVLSCLLVPVIIFKMDAYYEHRAAKKAAQVKKEAGILS